MKHDRFQLARFLNALTALTVFSILPVFSLAAEPQKQKNDADERRLRNELKEREQEIQKLRKDLAEQKAENRKLDNEINAWRKKPVVPNDNIVLTPYDASGLFAKETPGGSGPVVFEIRKGATLLLVRKTGGGKGDGKSAKWEYLTVRLTPEHTKEIRVNLHKGEWNVYRSNPKAGYMHIGDVKVTDKGASVTIPDD